MIREALTNVGVLLKPARYALEEAIYRTSYKATGLTALRNRFRGRPMLVVGNGPSLNKTPLDDFAHVPSIGMNKIDLIYSRTSWRPAFVVCTNDMVVRQHWESWLAAGIDTFLSWKSRWHVPGAHRSKFPYFLTRNARDFRGEVEDGLGSGFTVTYTALQLAYYCGADPVILVGVDHSFVQNDRPGVYEKQAGPDVNHFDPNYFQSGTLWGLANLAESENDYKRALAAFEADGRRVLDATVDGKLTVFPKISLDEARSLVSK